MQENFHEKLAFAACKREERKIQEIFQKNALKVCCLQDQVKMKKMKK